MLTSEDNLFLQDFVRRVKEKPELVGHVITAITKGVCEAVEAHSTRANDMEVVASMAMHTRLFKGNERFIAQKIRTYSDKKQTALKWDDVLERLEK